MAFVVDSVTCVKKDDALGKDEVDLTGFAVDLNGTEQQVAPFFVGKFKKGQTIALGQNGRLFSFDIDNSAFAIPHSFTAALLILERDLFDRDVAVKLVTTFTIIAIALNTVALALFVAQLGLIAFVLAGVGAILEMFALYVFPALADDLSFAANDTLEFVGGQNIGTVFNRTLQIGDGTGLRFNFDGQYTVNARWVAEA